VATIVGAIGRFVAGLFVGALSIFIFFAWIALLRILGRAVARRVLNTPAKEAGRNYRVPIGCPLPVWVLASITCGIVFVAAGGPNRSRFSTHMSSSSQDGNAAAPAATPGGNGQENEPQAAAGEGAVVKFVRFSVHDAEVNNIEAFSILVPEGWKCSGSVVWDPNFLVQANLRLRITDPQSGAEIEYLPAQYYVFQPGAVIPQQPGGNSMGAIVWQPITDLEQYMRTMYVPQPLPELQDATRIGQQEMPKIAALLQQASGNQSQAKSGRVRFAYSVNGQPWEEDVYLTLVYTPAPGVTMWNVQSASVVRAPKGQLDRMTPLMMSILCTERTNQDWFSALMYVRDLFHQRMMGAIQDAGALSQRIAQNGEEIRQMYSDSYKNLNESEDRIDQSFSETIRGVSTYANPYEERPVELPSGYNDAWVNSNGEYILSNQAGYDPNVGATTEWRRMNQRGENGQ
jgi:hypothetical protein